MDYKLGICLSVVCFMTFQVSFSQKDDEVRVVTQELLSKAAQFQKALQLKIAVLQHVATLTQNLVQLNKLRDAGVKNATFEATVEQEIASIIPEANYYIDFQEKDLADARVIIKHLMVAQKELQNGK